MDQSNLLKTWAEFNKKSKPRTREDKDLKRNTFESVNALYEGRELIFNAFRREIFPIKETQVKGLKILTPKQMLQRLPITPAQVKEDSTSKNLLDENRQILYSLYQVKEITKKVYNNIMNSVIRYNTKIDSTFLNSKNSKTYDPHRLLFSLTDKRDLRKKDKHVALSNLITYYTRKNIKKSYENNKFKISPSTWNEKFELPNGSYSISDIQDYFEYILRKHGVNIDNPHVLVGNWTVFENFVNSWILTQRRIYKTLRTFKYKI